MAAEGAFWGVMAAALVGLSLSVAIERLLMRPRARLARGAAAWALHGGLWLWAYGVMALLLGRPWFACAAVSACMLTLVLVNNAKLKALHEPFVWPDFEYFTDAIRHPRLYIPFLGWGKFLLAALGFVVAVAVGLWGEAVPLTRFAWSGQLGGIVALLALGTAALVAGMRAELRVCFDAGRDVAALGLLASLWRYAEESGVLPPASEVRVEPDAVMGATVGAGARQADDEGGARVPPGLSVRVPGGALPHRVVVQSESFFDARALFPGIRPAVLAEFDRLKAESVCHGKLKVPAWGANTVRTEFAFLSGLDQDTLGVHRFNPYRAVAKGWRVCSLASKLKALGYRTIAIHPYPASFYQREYVYPRLGFDEFLDVCAFAGAERSGPYIADLAVARKIEAVLARAEGPVFVFAVTMENHGPLHLETVAEGDVQALYCEPPPPGCEDLTIYLRHLRNADRMMAALRATLDACARPAELCLFGDHVPIMPQVYQTLGAPAGEVDYVLWRSPGGGGGVRQDLEVARLAETWLRSSQLETGSSGPQRQEPG